MKLSDDLDTLTIGGLERFLTDAKRAGARGNTEVGITRRRSDEHGSWTIEVDFDPHPTMSEPGPED